MNRLKSVTKPLMWFMAILLTALAAGCGGSGGGGQGTILGIGGAGIAPAVAPTVVAIAPLPNAVGVPINTKIIAAAFSKPMNAATITPTSFTLACGAAGIPGSPKTLVPATPYLVAGPGNVFELVQPLLSPNLPATADCTATVTTAAQDATGLALLSNFAWTFTTGVAPDITKPRVTVTDPLTLIPIQAGVPIGTAITATFSKDMDPSTIVAPGAFTVKETVSGLNVPALSVTYVVGNKIATFTPTTVLKYGTSYTATIASTAADTVLPPNLLAGGASATIAAPYVWSFITGVAPDTTKPRVQSTIPVNLAPAVAPNAAISAIFTKAMNPATIIAPGTFTLKETVSGLNVTGGPVTYTYLGGISTATFTPGTTAGGVFTPVALKNNMNYTATITSAATDTVIPVANVLAGGLAGAPNPTIAANYVWTFQTAPAPVVAIPVTVLFNSPVAGALSVCPSATISATFSVPMNAILTTAAFTLADTAVPPNNIPGAATLDATLMIATFTPLNPLVNGTTYKATIKGGPTGVKDLAIPANTMTLDSTLTFTAGPATGICLPPVALGRASTFGISATAGVTNTPTVPITNIHGDVVVDPLATCNAVAVDNIGGFGLCGGSPPVIVGTVVTPTFPAGASAGAKADLLAAFLSITPPAGPPAAGALGGGTPIAAPTTLGAIGAIMVPGQNYFTPGVYTSITSIMISNDLTLDALGNPNAVFIFQSASTLGTAAGAPSPGVRTRILLIGGAKASNVFWQVGTSATLGLYSEFQGNILASASITMLTGATSCGRLLAGAFTAGAFVFDSNVVSVPGQPFAPPATYSPICQ